MTQVTEKDITQWVIDAKEELEELRGFKQQVRELTRNTTCNVGGCVWRYELQALIGDKP